MSKCRYAGFSALRMCTEFPGISPPGTGGVGGLESMPYSSLQGGLAMERVIFSYKPRTPGSGGVGHRGGHFQLQTTYSRFRGGLAMGGSFSATNYVLPVPGGGWPWGGHFQLQTTYSRFRGGVGHGGVIFSYKLRTPGSGGGVAMGGSFSATNRVLPIPAEKARPARRDFRGVTPELVYRFSGGRRARPDGPGNPGPGHPEQAVLRPPEGPF